MAATCVISCAICPAHVTLLVNKKDGVRVVYPLIHFFTKSSKTSENTRNNSTSIVSTRHVYPVDTRKGRLHGSLVMRSDLFSTENGLKSV